MDSPRSIAEGMFCTWTQGGERYEGTQREGFNHASDCLKHRLLALCDEAEKTDLVQALRTPINYVTYLGDAATIANQVRAKIADELATWIAARGIQP